MPPSPPPMTTPSTASLKAWWRQFTVLQKLKSKPNSSPTGAVFGVPLRQSLRYASVQISTANQNGELYVWGYIPVVVAKCGLFLKEKGTEVEGIFRVSGSAKRMRELQDIFETPPRYGKNIQWQDHYFTPHDVASVFRRFLTSMPEPIIPHSLYHDFRNAYSKKPFTQEEVIVSYKRLIARLPLANQYLLLYVLDLLTVFAKKSEANKMPASNLAVIFRPAVLNHPSHEMSPEHHKLSQDVLEFLIEHQDWFMLDIPPPPRKDSILHPADSGRSIPTLKSTKASQLKNALAPITNQVSSIPHPKSPTKDPGEEEDFNVYVGPMSDEDDSGAETSGWRLVGSAASVGASVGRRRTFSERGSPRRLLADEQGRTVEGRKSAENISTSAPNVPSAFRSAAHLTPVREASSNEVPAVSPTNTVKANAISGGVSSAHESRTGSESVEGTEPSVEGGPTNRGRRAKFDDEQIAKDQETKKTEQRGRPTSKGFFGGGFSGVRRSRTVEGTSSNNTPKGTLERHLLKKRNSRGEVEKIER